MRRIRFNTSDPLAGLRSAMEFQRQVDRVMDGLLGSMTVMRHAAAVWPPALDVCETAEAYFITVELAGVPVESLEVTVQEHGLTVRGVRSREPLPEGASCQVMEINYGPFERELGLVEPVAPDQVNAEFHDGLLRITLRKIEPRRQQRRITVQ